MIRPAGIVLIALAALTAAHAAEDAAQKQRELEAVRERIQRLDAEVQADVRARGALQTELRRTEKEVATVAGSLRDHERELARARSRLETLKLEQAERSAALEAEQGALADQLRAAYRTGREERVKLLLNQEDPALLGRVMAYYRYFTDSRTRTIEAVLAQLEALAEVERQVGEEAVRVERLVSERRAQLAELGLAREARGEALAALNAEIRAQGRELEELRADEAGLVTLIQHLTSELSDIPPGSLPAFEELKRELAWPLRGPVMADFGDPRSGGRLRWQGVWISADPGTEVRAVAHGRVAYADWLPGLGLLLVIEHGDGYLSLYGHNRVLYRSPGDWVTPGDVISAAGDSGGQARSGVYFEIRKGQRPLDPRGWMTSRSPASP